MSKSNLKSFNFFSVYYKFLSALSFSIFKFIISLSYCYFFTSKLTLVVSIYFINYLFLSFTASNLCLQLLSNISFYILICFSYILDDDNYTFFYSYLLFAVSNNDCNLYIYLFLSYAVLYSKFIVPDISVIVVGCWLIDCAKLLFILAKCSFNYCYLACMIVLFYYIYFYNNWIFLYPWLTWFLSCIIYLSNLILSSFNVLIVCKLSFIYDFILPFY